MFGVPKGASILELLLFYVYVNYLPGVIWCPPREHYVNYLPGVIWCPPREHPGTVVVFMSTISLVSSGVHQGNILGLLLFLCLLSPWCHLVSTKGTSWDCCCSYVYVNYLPGVIWCPPREHPGTVVVFMSTISWCHLVSTKGTSWDCCCSYVYVNYLPGVIWCPPREHPGTVVVFMSTISWCHLVSTKGTSWDCCCSYVYYLPGVCIIWGPPRVIGGYLFRKYYNVGEEGHERKVVRGRSWKTEDFTIRY